jgi:multimeric flavodoxin WrbA
MLKDLAIAPCNGCGSCAGGNPCVLHDDMEELYLDLETCMALTISLPLYFSGVPAGLKALIDRGEYLWRRKQAGHCVRARNAAVIITAGSDYAGMFDGALQCLRHFFSTVNIRIDAAHSLLVRNTDGGNRSDVGTIRAAAEGFYRGSSL